jgi:hypothetical protein
MIDRWQRQAARGFAITTLLTLVLITIAYSRFYGPFLVWDHDVETARNFIAHEQLVHYYIASAVVYGLGMIAVLTALYVVLKPISRGLALFAVFTRLVYVIMWFVGLLGLFSALRIIGGGGYLQVFEPERLQALAGLQLASGWDAYYIGLTCYAIGWVLFSYLFFKSSYVPRALAGYGVLSALFEGVCGFAYLNHRGFGAIVSVHWYEMPVVVFEVVLSVWILVRGLRPPESAKPMPAGN